MTKPRSRRGFTLIELLTVIAIIGILAAIIIPTVGKVRATAKKANCASNLRQLGMASQMFSNENKGAMIILDSGNGQYWFRQIYPYLKNDGRPRITPVLQCPNDAAALAALEDPNSYEFDCLSYMFLKEKDSWRKVSQIPDPSRHPQFIDAELTNSNDYRTAAKFEGKVKGTATEWRHGNGVNVAYWDAHVAFVPNPTYEGVFNLTPAN